MHTLRTWKAQRSGAAMRVIGTDEAGKSVKLTNVQEIEVNGAHVLAKTADGVRHILARVDAEAGID